MDYFEAMRNAASISTKIEIYLKAEPHFNDDMLQLLVKASNSKEVAACYQEKIEQEKYLFAAKEIPARYKDIARKERREKRSRKAMNDETTNEDWD